MKKGLISDLSSEERRIRVLVAKPGLDGHDRGAKIIVSGLRNAGMEVIYTGLHQTPEAIVSAALQEDVDVIGLSLLSGGHKPICRKTLRLLAKQGVKDIKVVVGGIIPHSDTAYLKRLGIVEVFGPGTTMDEIVKVIEEIAATRTRQTSARPLVSP